MQYFAPGAAAPYPPRAMNEPGLTHLSISVDDVRATAEKAVEYGGEIIEGSDVGASLLHPGPRRPTPRAAARDLPGQLAAEALTRDDAVSFTGA